MVVQTLIQDAAKREFTPTFLSHCVMYCIMCSGAGMEGDGLWHDDGGGEADAGIGGKSTPRAQTPAHCALLRPDY